MFSAPFHPCTTSRGACCSRFSAIFLFWQREISGWIVVVLCEKPTGESGGTRRGPRHQRVHPDTEPCPRR